MSEQMDDLRPWTPTGARAFVDGDRVEIRISPECACYNETRGGVGKHTFRGMRGHVVSGEFPDSTVTKGHHVAVYLDSPIQIVGDRIIGGFFAPSELELLEATR